ncbi:RidA family protein [Streptomyces sp. NPDC003860]
MSFSEFGPRMVGGKLMYNHAIRVDGTQSLLFVAGHEARDEGGTVIHQGDMAGQIRLTLKRIGQTVTAAGMTMADVVQIRVFTTDLAECKAQYGVLMDELAAVHCRPASLLAEVSALSDPHMLIEIEAIAARGK